MTVFIYNDHGTTKIGAELMCKAFRRHGIEAEFIRAATIRENDSWMEEAQLLVFAGKSVGEFKEALGQEGLGKIRTAVGEAGVKYLGVCAGGIFGSAEFCYNGCDRKQDKPYWKTGEGLGLSQVFAQGSLGKVVPRPYTEDTETAAVLPFLHGDLQTRFRAFYWGGAAFFPYEKDPRTRVIAWLINENNQPALPLGIQSRFGTRETLVTLLGYHPEIRSADIEQWIRTGEPSAKSHDEALIARSMEPETQEQIRHAFPLLLQDLNLRMK